jgi:hypothetical protein
MKLRSTTITAAELETIANRLGFRAEIGEERTMSRGADAGRHEIRFVLRPNRGVDTFRAIDPISGRRKAAICWHGHYAAMRAIFALETGAKLKTAVATYDGATAFEELAPATRHRNIGSIAEPATHEDGCECDGTATRTPTGAAYDLGGEIALEILEARTTTCDGCGGTGRVSDAAGEMLDPCEDCQGGGRVEA